MEVKKIMNPFFLQTRNFVLTCTGTVLIAKNPSVRVHVFLCFCCKNIIVFHRKILD